MNAHRLVILASLMNAHRLVILAFEDIDNADSRGLTIL